MTDPGAFAAVFAALYAGHHVGDYWIQTDHQARHKGLPGLDGALHCLQHVSTYLATQLVCLFLMTIPTGVELSDWGVLAMILVSGVTHYMADRREHGLMFKLARRLPGKAAFMELGKPRGYVGRFEHLNDPGTFGAHLDNPQLATGAWALDQAWHIFWGVFVAALVAVTL